VSEPSRRKIHCSGTASTPVGKTDSESPRRNRTIPESIYPEVTDLEQATPILLRDNQAGWAEVRVKDSPAVEVTGSLANHASVVSLTLNAESGGLTLDADINPQYNSNTGGFANRISLQATIN
jgi:hypothetical protein